MLWRHNLYISVISGILWNVLCFFFFHVLHNFQFYRGKTGHSNGIMSKSPIKRTSSCKWRCQHAGKHLLGRNKTTAQNGKPKPHAALYACIYLGYAGYFGMIYVFFVFVMFDKKKIHRHNLYISGICGILWNALCCLHFFVMIYIIILDLIEA